MRGVILLRQYMNTLPDEIQTKIYRMKHELEFRRVVKQLNCLEFCDWCGTLHFYLECPFMLHDSDSDDSDMIYLDSDSNDDPNIIYI